MIFLKSEKITKHFYILMIWPLKATKWFAFLEPERMLNHNPPKKHHKNHNQN